MFSDEDQFLSPSVGVVEQANCFFLLPFCHFMRSDAGSAPTSQLDQHTDRGELVSNISLSAIDKTFHEMIVNGSELGRGLTILHSAFMLVLSLHIRLV